MCVENRLVKYKAFRRNVMLWHKICFLIKKSAEMSTEFSNYLIFKLIFLPYQKQSQESKQSVDN